jgi:two-component system nitrogen regulation response regulator GlnG
MGRPANPRDLLVAESEVMRQVVAAIETAASVDEPVLVVGEPGTGRELVARLIHLASRRRSKAFTTVRAGCAPRAIFTDDIEGSSNLAFHQADGGTLLVKDVCELGRAAQRKLSRVLRGPKSGAREGDGPESVYYDFRVVATSDPGLDLAVRAEVFNRVLYERLAGCTIQVPPLRDRTEDIALLAERLVRHYAREIGRARIKLSTRAFDRLVSYPWPGNVAELKGLARRLVVVVKGNVIQAGDVDAVLPSLAERVPLEQMSLEEMVRCKLAAFLRRLEGYPVAGVHEDVLARVERPLLDLVMEHTGGNQVKAAEILGLNRNTLRRKLNEHGLVGRKPAAATDRKRSGRAL